MSDPVLRFLSRVNAKEGKCWEFAGTLCGKGYKQFRHKSIREYAHRFMWKVMNGAEIPKGKVIMHKCDNPACCNPDHLQLGTQTDNIRDMVRKGRQVNAQTLKTHCRNGHEYNEKNTYILRLKTHTERRCRVCMAERARKKRAANN